MPLTRLELLSSVTDTFLYSNRNVPKIIILNKKNNYYLKIPQMETRLPAAEVVQEGYKKETQGATADSILGQLSTLSEPHLKPQNAALQGAYLGYN